MRFSRMTTRRWMLMAAAAGAALGIVVSLIPSGPFILVWTVGPCFAALLVLSIPLMICAYCVSRLRRTDVPSGASRSFVEPDPPAPE